MKHSILYGGLISFAFLTLFAFKGFQKDTENNGVIGDVKYSILEPNTFYKVNGKGWVLMDGRSIDSSALFNLGQTRIPDARGLFIRAMDMGRDTVDNKGDPEWSSRDVITPQMDDFRKHNHHINIVLSHGNWAYGGNNWATQTNTDPKTADSFNEGGKETRPKNIALYIYIKIK